LFRGVVARRGGPSETRKNETMKILPRHETFDTWEEAFDACRERNRPIVVRCDEDGKTEVSKIYPSGHSRVVYLCDGILPCDAVLISGPSETEEQYNAVCGNESAMGSTVRD